MAFNYEAVDHIAYGLKDGGAYVFRLDRDREANLAECSPKKLIAIYESKQQSKYCVFISHKYEDLDAARVVAAYI